MSEKVPDRLSDDVFDKRLLGAERSFRESAKDVPDFARFEAFARAAYKIGDVLQRPKVIGVVRALMVDASVPEARQQDLFVLNADLSAAEAARAEAAALGRKLANEVSAPIPAESAETWRRPLVQLRFDGADPVVAERFSEHVPGKRAESAERHLEAFDDKRPKKLKDVFSRKLFSAVGELGKAAAAGTASAVGENRTRRFSVPVAPILSKDAPSDVVPLMANGFGCWAQATLFPDGRVEIRLSPVESLVYDGDGLKLPPEGEFGEPSYAAAGFPLAIPVRGKAVVLSVVPDTQALRQRGVPPGYDDFGR